AAPAGQGSGQIWAGNADNVPAGTQASIAVPADTLSDGWKVRWRARAVSPTAASAWSDWQAFTVEVPKPTVQGLAITPSKVVDGATVTTTLTPALKATVTHPTGQALRAEVEIEHDPAAPAEQGTGQIWAGAVNGVASGTQASIAVPANTLTDGWKVRWRLRAVTGDASSAWSDWQQVTVDVTQPGEEPLAQTTGPVIRTDQSFTAAAWLRWNDKDGDYTVLEQKGTHQAPFRLGNTPDHGLVFTFTSADTTNATAEGLVSDVEPPVNEWFHLAGVYDAAASSATLYLNGNPIKTGPINFASWNADSAMTLGTSMRGDLDDVQIYQRPLSASDLSGLLGSMSTQSPSQQETVARPNKANSSKPISKAASGIVPFNYQHISLEECMQAQDEAGQHHGAGYGYPAHLIVRPYSSCWSVYYYKVFYIRDRASGNFVFEENSPGLEVRATWVMSTYLGNAAGTSVVNGGSSGLKPQQISFWTRIKVRTFDDQGHPTNQDDNERLHLMVTPVATPGDSTCVMKSGASREASVHDWKNGIDNYFLFESGDTNGDRNDKCTLRPLLYDVYSKWTNKPMYLWSQVVYNKEGKKTGYRYGNGEPWDVKFAPHVRCDWMTFGKTQADPNGSSLKSATADDGVADHTGACINISAKRIFVMSKSRNSSFLEVIEHIEDALNPAVNSTTFPPLRDDETQDPPLRGPLGNEKSKIISGNWGAPHDSPAGQALERTDEQGQLANRGVFSGNMFFAEGKKYKKSLGTNYCKYYFEDKYANSPQRSLQCDEYPFASTVQGAEKAKGNYSLRAVSQKHNSSHGGTLGRFYTDYRVGTGNHFWVWIVS
ncbi:LamG-like jellyroll fold domain-containing protein, partial [Streptosporangium saharense]|uniref:LamG-like jellyroll fold domain-containing protein n=1 Tax=Streptosporangium saharense TaxID=1706840 RepID=UPI0036A949DD